jgi:hypothetical protein
MRTVVFAGPSLPHDRARQLVPTAVIRPPVRRGELLRQQLGPGDVAVILDGYYFQVPTLQHAEILEAVARGIHVVGASSLGALRAAELRGSGMVGLGTIFDAYARGALVGDDEVAVLHDAESFRQLSIPLVDLRASLALAIEDGRVSIECADFVLRALKPMWFGDRTAAALRRLLDRSDHAPETSAVMACTDRHRVGQKRADAELALRTVVGGALPRLTPRPVARTVFGYGLVREHAADALDTDLAIGWLFLRGPDPRGRESACRDILLRLQGSCDAHDGTLEQRVLEALIASDLLDRGAVVADIAPFVEAPSVAPGVRVGAALVEILRGAGELEPLRQQLEQTPVRDPPHTPTRLLAPLLPLWGCNAGAVPEQARQRGLGTIPEVLRLLGRPRVWTLVHAHIRTMGSRHARDDRNRERTDAVH